MNERRKPNLTADPSVAGRTHTAGGQKAESTVLLAKFRFFGSFWSLLEPFGGFRRFSEGGGIRTPVQCSSVFAGGFDATFRLRQTSTRREVTKTARAERRGLPCWVVKSSQLGDGVQVRPSASIRKIRRRAGKFNVQSQNGSRVELRSSRHGATRYLAAGRRRNSQPGRRGQLKMKKVKCKMGKQQIQSSRFIRLRPTSTRREVYKDGARGATRPTLLGGQNESIGGRCPSASKCVQPEIRFIRLRQGFDATFRLHPTTNRTRYSPLFPAFP
jgi:hypothetical protein